MDEHEPPSSFDAAWTLTVLGSIADAVIAADRDDRIRFLNPAAEAFTGWSLEEARGRPITDVFGPIGEARSVKSILLIRRDGLTLPIEHNILPIMGAAGRRFGTVVVFHGVEERRRAEEIPRIPRRSEEQFQALFNLVAAGIVPTRSGWALQPGEPATL